MEDLEYKTEEILVLPSIKGMLASSTVKEIKCTDEPVVTVL